MALLCVPFAVSAVLVERQPNAASASTATKIKTLLLNLFMKFLLLRINELAERGAPF